MRASIYIRIGPHKSTGWLNISHYHQNCACQVFNFRKHGLSELPHLGNSFLLLSAFVLWPWLSFPFQYPFPTAHFNTHPGNPSPLPPFRRRVLLDDFGWVPVVPIDQRPDPGRLGRGREGGGDTLSPPAGLWKQPLPQLGRGSCPAERPADPHVPSRQLRARRCEIRHLSATARQRPAPPPAWPRPLSPF